MSLLDKYKPIECNDIIGNKKKYYKLLNELEESKFKGKYLLYGDSGTGKSTFVNIIASTKKLKVENINIYDINLENCNTIFKKTIQKKIIIIDYIDINISSINTKLKNLKLKIDKDKNNLIFFISNGNKKTTFNYKDLKSFKFSQVDEKLLFKYVNNIFKKEEIKISKKNKDNIIKKIIINGNYNIRKILINLNMLLLDCKKLLYTEKNKYLITKNINDKNFSNIYNFLHYSLKPHKKNNIESYLKRENLFYNDPFTLESSVFEYYLKGENIKKDIIDNKSLDKMYNIINSICDSDTFEEKYLYPQYVCNNSYIIPLQSCGKPTGNIFYPSNVSSDRKVSNNNNKLIKLKDNNIYFNHENLIYLYKIQKKLKIKKKKQIINNTDIKKIFSLVNID